MSKYTCPNCNGGFDKTELGKCPHCGVELQHVRVTEKGKRGFSYIYTIKNTGITGPPPAPARPNIDTKPLPSMEPEPVEAEKLVEAIDYWLFESDPGDIPTIERKYTPDNKETSEWRVTYNNVVYTGWVYCPNCWSKMFQNMVVNSLFLEQHHKCRSCKHTVTYIFNTSNVRIVS